jgi:uncharacterized delta-60 repeat protein
MPAARCLLVAIAIALLFAAPAHGRPARGVVALYPELYSFVHKLERLPDGRLLATGGVRRGERDLFAAIRLSANGRQDRSFGRRGLAEVRIGGGYFTDPTALLVQPDGRFVVAGTVSLTKNLVFGSNVIGAARFLPNGRLDRSFGTRGKTTWTAGHDADNEPRLAARPDGTALLVVGSQVGGTGFGLPVGCVLPLDAAYRQSGAGFCEVPPGLGYGDFTDVAPDGSGGAVIAVSGERAPRNKVFGIARVDAAGAIDTAFGNGGYNTSVDFGPRPSAGIVQGASVIAPRLGGGWLVGGAAPGARVGLAAFTATGAVDAGFGGGGTLAFDSNPGPNEIVVTSLVPLRDGSTLVVGWEGRRGLLTKVSADGRLVPGFGNGGTMVVTGRSLGVDHVDSLLDAVEQPDGRIVVIGSYYERLRDTIGMLAIRVRPDGRLDRSFGPKRRR